MKLWKYMVLSTNAKTTTNRTRKLVTKKSWGKYELHGNVYSQSEKKLNIPRDIMKK